MHKGFQITGGPSSRLEKKKLKKKNYYVVVQIENNSTVWFMDDLKDC